MATVETFLPFRPDEPRSLELFQEIAPLVERQWLKRERYFDLIPW